VRALVAVVIVIVGVLGIIVGILYLTQPAHALPSFFPGYAAHVAGKHPHRGIAAIAVGAVVIVIGLVVGLTGRRQRRLFY
jgi:hypothetical protein